MAEYDLVEERLQVGGRLDDNDEEEFRRWCLDVFLSGADAVTVDLSGVERICSRCVGTLVTLWIDLRAVERGLRLTTSPAVKKVLDLSGLSTVLLAGARGTQFELAGTELRVSGTLDESNYSQFVERCQELLRTGGDPVRVDLSRVDRVSSRCIGALASLLIDLRGAGRDLRVIASPSVGKFLELCGLDAVLPTETDKEFP